MTLYTIVGIAASVLTATSQLPQLIKLLNEKKANDVSLGMLAILFAGLGLWIYYGYLKKDFILIIANSFSFIINLVLAGFAMKYKKKNN